MGDGSFAVAAADAANVVVVVVGDEMCRGKCWCRNVVVQAFVADEDGWQWQTAAAVADDDDVEYGWSRESDDVGKADDDDDHLLVPIVVAE